MRLLHGRQSLDSCSHMRHTKETQLSSVFALRGRCLRPTLYRQQRQCSGGILRLVAQAAEGAQANEAGERLRLNNLAPQPGSRRKNLRKGRGYGGSQGGTCGFGMRGQNSRSGSGTKPGFEGGQMPLYRRVPKLRGIAGGMSAGVPKYVIVNLSQLSAFKEQEEVTLEALQQKRILNISGKEKKLPLKILGNGELTVPLTCKAVSFSSSAKEKIEKAGGKAEEIPGRIKWTRAIGRRRAAEKAGATKSQDKGKK